jgi:hypothetical protein
MTSNKPTLPWRLVIVVGLVFGSMDSVESTMTTTMTMFPSIQRGVPSSPRLPILLLSLRGGATTSTSTGSSVSSGTTALSSKNKTKKKKSKKQSKPVTEDDEDGTTTTTTLTTADPDDDDDATSSPPATTTTTTTTKSSSSKSKISKAMKEKDAAEALGDAIRYVHAWDNAVATRTFDG